MLHKTLSIILLSCLLMVASAGYSRSRRPRKHREEMQPEESSYVSHHHSDVASKHGTYWDGWMKGWYDGLRLCSEKHGYGQSDDYKNPYDDGQGYIGPVRFGHANSRPVHFYVKHGLDSFKSHKSYKGYNKGWH